MESFLKPEIHADSMTKVQISLHFTGFRSPAQRPVAESSVVVILLGMSCTLVECVPNFSEGRDPAKVDAIVEAMKIPGVYLLDREMDSDHNRCVITLVGEREAIQEAVLRGVGKAAELIDLTSTLARTRAWRD